MEVQFNRQEEGSVQSVPFIKAPPPFLDASASDDTPLQFKQVIQVRNVLLQCTNSYLKIIQFRFISVFFTII